MTAEARRLPYPGLRAFNRDESDLFFGRDTAISDMIASLARTRFLAVLGSSGTGKSSVVKTGLFDGLELGFHPAGSNWRFAVMVPGGRPIRNLAAALLDLSGGDSLAAEKLEDLNALEWFLRRGPRSLVEWMAAGHLPPDTHLLVLVDQFEELFRFASYDSRETAEAFVKLLIQASEEPQSRVSVVLTMRSEFLGACSLIPGLAERINRGFYLTPRMTRDECRLAIVGPARMVGAELEPALLNQILNDLAGFAPWGEDASADQLRSLSRRADQLPVMQHLLNRMWQRAAQAGSAPVRLALEDYAVIGGLKGALDSHGEEIMAGLDEGQRAIVPKLFRAMVDGASVATATRRAVRLGDLAEEISVPSGDLVPIVEAFRAPSASFLRPEPPAPLTADTILDISHESLIRQWSRFTGWMNEEARAASSLRRLGNAEARFRSGEGDLLAGLDLANLSDWWRNDRPNPVWANRYGQDFAALEAFLERSEQAAQERSRAATAAQRRFNRRMMGLLGLTTALALVAGGLYFDGHTQRIKAEESFARFIGAIEALAIDQVERLDGNQSIPAQSKLDLIGDTERVLSTLAGAVDHQDSMARQQIEFHVAAVETLLDLGYKDQALSHANRLVDQVGRAADLPSGDGLRAALGLAAAYAEVQDADASRRWAAAAADQIEASAAAPVDAMLDEARLLRIQSRLAQSSRDHAGVIAAADALWAGFEDLDPLRSEADADPDDPSGGTATTLQIARASFAASIDAATALSALDLDSREGMMPAAYVARASQADRAMSRLAPADNRQIRHREVQLRLAEAKIERRDNPGALRAFELSSTAVDLATDLAAEDPSHILYKEDLVKALIARSGVAAESGNLPQARADAEAALALLADLRLLGLSDFDRIAHEHLALHALWMSLDPSEDAVERALARARLRSLISQGERGPAALSADLAEARLYALLQGPDSGLAAAQAAEDYLALGRVVLDGFPTLTPTGEPDYFGLSLRYYAHVSLLGLPVRQVGRDRWFALHDQAVSEARRLVDLAPGVRDNQANLALLMFKAGLAHGALGETAPRRAAYLAALEHALAALQLDPEYQPGFANALRYAAAYAAASSPPLSGPELATLDAYIETVVAAPRNQAMLFRAQDDAGLLRQALEQLIGPNGAPPAALPGAAPEALVAELDAALIAAQAQALADPVLHGQALRDGLGRAGTGQDMLRALRSIEIGKWTDSGVDGLGWAWPPLLPGVWQVLDGAEFDATLAMIQNAAPGLPATPIQYIRQIPLGFYRDGRLVEAQFGVGAGSAIRSFLVIDGQRVFALDGQIGAIDAANAAGALTITDAAAAGQYLMFLTHHVEGGDGPFLIVEHVDDIPWKRDAPVTRIEDTQRFLRPFLVWEDPERSGVWRATASVLHGGSIFHAGISVTRDGKLDFRGDAKLASGLPVRGHGVSDRATGEERLDLPVRPVDLARLGTIAAGDIGAEAAAVVARSAALPPEAGDPLRAQYAELLLGAEARATVADYPRVLADLADSMLRMNASADVALNLARQARAELPDDPGLAGTLGWALVRTGNLQEGLDLLRKAVSDAPAEAASEARLAEALRMAGQTDKARIALERARNLGPDTFWTRFIDDEVARLASQ